MTEKKDRIITVDGIGYSLDTGKAVGPAQAKSQPAESAPSSDKSSNTLDLRHFAPTPMANPSANTKSMSAKKPTSPDKTAQDKPSVKSSDGLSGQERRGQVEKKKSHKTDSPITSQNTSETAPQPHRKVGQGYLKLVFVQPFTRRVDRYVVQSILLSTMISPQFWALALLPGLVVRIIKVQHYTVADLLGQVRLELAPTNYFRLAAIVATILVISLISALVAYLVRMVARATRLRELDNRSISINLLYRQAMNKSWRALITWLLNILLWLAVSALASYTIWWLVRSQNSLIISTLSAILPFVIALWLSVLVVLAMRLPIAQTMIAATDQSVWYVQAHSMRLAFGSFVKNILSALWFVVVSLLFTSLLGLVAWAGVTYLSSSKYLYMQIGLFVVGAVLTLAILVMYRIWCNMFLAGHYYSLVSTRGRVAMSSYLSPVKPVKTTLTPFIVLTGLLFVIVIGYGVTIFTLRTPAIGLMSRLYDKVPAQLEFKIPKP